MSTVTFGRLRAAGKKRIQHDAWDGFILWRGETRIPP